MKRTILYILLLITVFSGCQKTDVRLFDDKTVISSDKISHPRATCFIEDTEGYIWIGTERGLNRFNGHEYLQFFPKRDNGDNISEIITTVFQDSKGRIWAGTMNGPCILENNGVLKRIEGDDLSSTTSQFFETSDGRILINNVRQLFEYDETEGKLKLLIENFIPQQQFRNFCFFDSQERLWSIVPGIARCYSTKTMELISSIPTGVEAFCAQIIRGDSIWIYDDNKGTAVNTVTMSIVPLPEQVRDLKAVNQILPYGDEVYINTPVNLYLYNLKEEKLKDSLMPYYEISDDQKTDINQIFIDNQGNIISADGRKGISFHKRSLDSFGTENNLFTHIGGFPVVSCYMDSMNRQWILSDRNSLHVYNRDTGFTDILDISAFQKYASRQIDQEIVVDNNGTVWLRVDGSLLELTYTPGNENAYGTLSLKKIHSEFIGTAMTLNITDNGDIWVGTGLSNLYKLANGQFVKTDFPAGYTNGFFSISNLPNGNICIGSYQSNPLIYNPSDNSVEVIHIWDDPNSQTDFVYCFLNIGQRLWIGTRNSGIFCYHMDSKELESFNSLPMRGATDIGDDRFGNLWVASENGLYRLSENGVLIGSYHAEDGLGGDQFIYHTFIKEKNGHLIFGGTHGLTVVNPNVYIPIIPRNLIFENFRIGGKIVMPMEGTALEAPLSAKPTVNLAHRDNNFSVSFIDLNPCGDRPAHYYYMLEGFDKDWIDIGSSRQAYFNNIPAGRYNVKVRIARSDQSVIEAEESFQLRVHSAPWASWWAKLLYLVVVCGIIWQIWLFRKRISEEKKAREQAAFEKEQERKVNDMNMRFFANISHEFRTPLTMISGPVGILEKTDYLQGREKQMVNTIKWNAARMLKLVNQLMDFNKLENDTLKLKVCQSDMVEIVKQTIAMFRINIEQKNISLFTEGLEDSMPAIVDPDKVDKVLTNLLSNAVKYTPEGGTICLKLDSDADHITIEVSDNGPSVPEDQLDKIFERYYQVDDHKNYGTGIGLYFSQRLMQLHKGNLFAQNLPQGIRFVAQFPAKDIYSDQEHINSNSIPKQAFVELETNQTEPGNHTHSILVVDDDPGVVNYLKMILCQDYNVFHAYDAENALQVISNDRPDIILSDVAMPGTDGYELCRKIKACADTCHLPVILVTAKTTTGDQITGLNTGADAYVTKPFDADYLLALIQSQLENRARIKGVIANATTTEEIEKEQPDALSEQDKILMERLYSIMEEELSNEEININKMTELMLMSRTKLYYKIKGLTGETPNNFFKKYKLNRAAEMLRSGKYNISEVSDLTGFSSPTVFSRNFRNHFGMTPTDYLKDCTQK